MSARGSDDVSDDTTWGSILLVEVEARLRQPLARSVQGRDVRVTGAVTAAEAGAAALGSGIA
jgi:ActR/RegA family two-component response regulator